MKKALEEATAAHLKTLDGMPEKRDAKIRRTGNGIIFYVFAAVVLALGCVVGVRGGTLAAIVLVSIAFYMAAIAGNHISGEMTEALAKSNPVLGGLLKIITGRLK